MANFVKESSEDLMYSAENDIITVKELLAEIFYPADRKYNIICFHATQAVEKLLKGYIIHNGISIGKIHNLVDLLRQAIKIESSFSEIIDNCLILNKLLPNLKYNSRKIISKQIIDETITSLEIICNFPIIKTMRDSYSHKYDYEIVAEISVK